MRLADFDVAKLASRAGVGGTTLTELADTLVRDHGLSFRSAHAIAALLLKARTEDPKAPLSTTLSKASAAILGKPLDYSEADLETIMSPAHFVEVRTTHGGPAPTETGRAIGESQRKLQTDREGWQARRERLAEGRSTPRRAREGALMKSTYVRVVIVWVRHARRALRVPVVLHPLDVARLTGRSSALYLVWIVWDGIRLRQEHREARRLFPRQPEPAVVGGRPVGDGDAVVGDHHGRAAPARATPTAWACCSSTTRCRSR